MYKRALEVLLSRGSLSIQWRQLSRRFSEAGLLEYLARLDRRRRAVPMTRDSFQYLEVGLSDLFSKGGRPGVFAA